MVRGLVRVALLGALSCVPLWDGAAFGQAVSAPVASAIEANAAPTREEVTRPQTTPSPRAPSRLTVEGGVQRAPCALSDARFADVKVTLSAVYFDHLRSVSPDELKPAFADMIGKTVPISAVCEIRDAAATILRGQGYLAAVQVPPQRIENGVVHLDVLMPKLVAVHVRGNPGKSAALIQAYLDELTGRETFNTHEAERYLLFTRDLPGYDVRLTLKPADDGVPGDVVGEVSVLKQPLAVDFNAQDYGSKQVGRWGGLLRGEVYDLLGLGDRLSLGIFSTSDFSEQQVLQSGYDFHVGPQGLAITSGFTYAWTHPDVGQPADPTAPRNNVRSRTLIANLGARYPLVRGQAANLSVAGGIDYINQSVRLNGIELTRDHLRTLYARLSGDVTDGASIRGENGFTAAEPRFRLSGTLEVRKGIDVLNATPRCDLVAGACTNLSVRSSRLDGHPRSGIFRGSAGAEYRPVPKVTLAVSAQGQYSADPTLQYEQFSAGNYTIGRGYDAGAIQGDSGAGVSGELRYGSLVPHTAKALAFQPYGFVDAAWTWRRGIDFAGPDHDRLVSAGGGVRAAWGNRARLDLGVAVPLEHVGRIAALDGALGFPGRRGDTRVLLSITTRILPWTR
jgi:hemolysin activation/secretion protein